MKRILASLMLVIILMSVGCTQAKFENKNNSSTATSSETVNTQNDTYESTTEKTSEATVESTEVVTERIVDKNKKMIAFTFDDGPCPNTNKILDIFNKYNGKATFFVVGNNLYRKDTLKRIVDEGHEIGSHTWSHSDLANLNSKGIKNDFIKMKDKIYEYTGYEIELLRPPYGSFDKTVKNTCKKLDIPIIMWDVDTLDWKSRKKKSIISVIRKKAKNGSIVLCHDLYDSTVEAIEKIVPEYIKKGYQLVTVSELLKADTDKIEPGLCYFSRHEAY